MRYAVALVAVLFLAGCPPVECDFDASDGLGVMPIELLGHWEGEARLSATDIRPVIIDFESPGFRFEIYVEGEYRVLRGSWGTQVEDEGWNRLDLYFQCLDGGPEVSSEWTIWAYEIKDGVLSFVISTDRYEEEGSPTQDAPFYELNRVE